MSSQSRKRTIRLSKYLKRLVKPFPRYGKAINTVVLLAFVLLVVAGVGAALTVHNKPTDIITKQTSSTAGNNCLLSNSGCPDSQKSSTSAQPAQSPATTSAPSTTTKPANDTQSQDSICGSPGSAGYQECIDNVNYINLSAQCDNEISTADNTLMDVVNQAKGTYNTDLANDDQSFEEQTGITSSELTSLEYDAMEQEVGKYNATVAPAWATYQSSFNSFNSQGCNQSMTYSESDIMMPVPPANPE